MKTSIETSWNDSVPPSFQSPVTRLSFLSCLAKISTHFCAVCHPKTSIWTTIFDEVDFGLPALGRQPLKPCLQVMAKWGGESHTCPPHLQKSTYLLSNLIKLAQIFRVVGAGYKTPNSGLFLWNSKNWGYGDRFPTHGCQILKISWHFENFELPNTNFLNKNAPELSVSGTALTILKIWAKNIQFEKSYSESKFGSETLYTGEHGKALN